MLAASLAIGVYFWWRGQADTKDFLLAGRSMATLPMTLSLIASFMSAITLLGVPAEIYTYGTQFLTTVVAYPLVMVTVAKVYLPVYCKLDITTSYEYLQLRFNSWVRLMASLLFTVQMVFYMAVVVYAPALALIQVTGLLAGVAYNVEIVCAAIFAICILYTSIGGIKAVVWTNSFQMLCMFGAFIAIIIKGSEDAGGAKEVFDRNYQAGRVEVFTLSADPRVRHTLWGTVVGSFFIWLSVYGTNHAQVGEAK